eukprot:UN12773
MIGAASAHQFTSESMAALEVLLIILMELSLLVDSFNSSQSIFSGLMADASPS